jgi:SAM-dependent methyltransferase
MEVCGGSLKGKRILDVACNCGGFSVEAVRRGAEYVFGFDTVDRYIEQANFIKRALKLPQVEFKVMDINSVEIETVGRFDVTFCFGILYHLENPIPAMKRISSVTQQAILVDTDLEVLSYKRRPFCGFFARKPFWLMNMPPIVTPESASATTSLWRKDRVVQFRPNDSAVVELLNFLGFGRVIKIPPKSKGLEARYYTGARGTFLGVRT